MIKTFLHSSVGSTIVTAVLFAIPWVLSHSAVDTITVGAVLRGIMTYIKAQTV